MPYKNSLHFTDDHLPYLPRFLAGSCSSSFLVFRVVVFVYVLWNDSNVACVLDCLLIALNAYFILNCGFLWEKYYFTHRDIRNIYMKPDIAIYMHFHSAPRGQIMG